MNESRRSGHPNEGDLQVLAEYVTGELVEDARSRVQEHLTVCAACRLERRGLARFLALEKDDELAAEGCWDRARSILDARLAARNLPAEKSTAHRPVQIADGARRRRSSTRSIWWIPVAAAAAIVLIFVGAERQNRSVTMPEGAGGPTAVDGVVPFRGGETTTMALVPQRPVGEVAAVPDTFIWAGVPRCNRYTLEIYTAELRTVYRHDRIEASFLALPESLQAQLQLDTTYFWSVQGFDELELVGTTPEVWFRIVR